MQTAIEMLAECLRLRHKSTYDDMYEDIEAYYKKIEQSQIEEAFYSGNQIPGNWENDSTNYYNETFNKQYETNK
jgi:hypothetical protein